MVKNLPCSAGGHRFDPRYRKIPHTTGQLSLCATSTEPESFRACALQQEKPVHGDDCKMHMCNKLKNKNKKIKTPKLCFLLKRHIISLSFLSSRWLFTEF